MTPDGPRRAPHGARGLKFQTPWHRPPHSWSRPARGAWIEISMLSLPLMDPLVAPRTGRVD